jgi:hypothetical protein
MSDIGDPTFHCIVEYDIDVPCVSMIWKGYATTAQFREANERVLQEIQQRRSSKLLSDAQEFVLIGATDQNWLSSNWIPRVLQAGVRKIALVMPRFYFNRVAVDAVTQRLAQNVADDLVSIEYFESRDAARTWLSGA